MTQAIKRNHAKSITINEKWIDAERATFTEQKDPKTGKRDLFLDALIVPFNEVSRNGILYGENGIRQTHAQLVGKPLMHNHVLEGADTLSRGEWIKTWLEKDGMHARAKIYDTSYNRDYIEWLQASSNPRVSLQVTGDATQEKDEKTEKYYQKAEINDWLEASTVVVPGFDDAKASFAVSMAESFGLKEKGYTHVERIIVKATRESRSGDKTFYGGQIIDVFDDDERGRAEKLLKELNRKHPEARFVIVKESWVEETKNAPRGVQPIDNREFGRKLMHNSDGTVAITLGETTFTAQNKEKLRTTLINKGLMKTEEEADEEDKKQREVELFDSLGLDKPKPVNVLEELF